MLEWPSAPTIDKFTRVLPQNESVERSPVIEQQKVHVMAFPFAMITCANKGMELKNEETVHIHTVCTKAFEGGSQNAPPAGVEVQPWRRPKQRTQTLEQWRLGTRRVTPPSVRKVLTWERS